MSRSVEQLLDLAEEQAADAVATAHAQAEALRRAACAVGTKIRAWLVRLDRVRRDRLTRRGRGRG